jgi:hypothetical protein
MRGTPARGSGYEYPSPASPPSALGSCYKTDHTVYTTKQQRGAPGTTFPQSNTPPRPHHPCEYVHSGARSEPGAQAGRRGSRQIVVGQVQVGEGGEGGQERGQRAPQLVVGEVQASASAQ